MREVLITPRAKRSLKKLDKTTSTHILRSFIKFAEEEQWSRHPAVKKLVGTDFYRYRLGDFRVIFDAHGNIFEIFDVRKRNESTYDL